MTDRPTVEELQDELQMEYLDHLATLTKLQALEKRFAEDHARLAGLEAQMRERAIPVAWRYRFKPDRATYSWWRTGPAVCVDSSIYIPKFDEIAAFLSAHNRKIEDNA